MPAFNQTFDYLGPSAEAAVGPILQTDFGSLRTIRWVRVTTQFSVVVENTEEFSLYLAGLSRGQSNIVWHDPLLVDGVDVDISARFGAVKAGTLWQIRFKNVLGVQSDLVLEFTTATVRQVEGVSWELVGEDHKFTPALNTLPNTDLRGAPVVAFTRANADADFVPFITLPVKAGATETFWCEVVTQDADFTALSIQAGDVTVRPNRKLQLRVEANPIFEQLLGAVRFGSDRFGQPITWEIETVSRDGRYAVLQLQSAIF